MPYVEYDEVEAICPDCGRTFRSEDALAAHRDESHSGVEEGPPTAGDPSEVCCPICRHTFASESALKIHSHDTHRGAARPRRRA